MSRTLLLGLAAATLLAASTAWSADPINPHFGDHCDVCHAAIPSRNAAGGMDYHFGGEDVDPSCLRCHGESQRCCSIGAEGFTHRSGIDRWDRRKYGRPRRLPLMDGYITCTTCHFYIRAANPAPRDYKLVRLMAFVNDAPDWAALCTDCHVDE
jgi:hypothetical protein